MAESTLKLDTKRLRLVAASAESVEAELRGVAELSAWLSARVPDEWPPPLNDESSQRWTLDYFREHRKAQGWVLWYFLRRSSTELSAVGGQFVAVGNGGFKGLPSADGTVEIGYSVLERYQRRGYATEAVTALVEWAFGDPRVHRVTAQTLPELRPSIRVLEKCGFFFCGEGIEDGAILFEQRRQDQRR